MRYLLYAFLIYLAYQFVFSFLIPVWRVSRKVKKGFRDMHQRMQEQEAANRQSQQQPSSAQPQNRQPLGDYIEFEEMK